MTEYRVVTIEPTAASCQGVVTLLPGQGYSAQGAILDYPAMALSEAGWSLRVVEWVGVSRNFEEIISVYDEVLRTSVTGNPGIRHLVLAKSVGSLTLPTALTLDVAGVWLTPLIAREGTVRDAVTRIGHATQPQLLIGGTTDPSWDRELAKASSASVLEVQYGNHSLETGSWRHSLAQVELVTAAIKEFAATLV